MLGTITVKIKVSHRVYTISVYVLLLSGLIYAQWGQFYERILVVLSVLLGILSVRSFSIVIKRQYHLSDIFFMACVLAFYFDSLFFMSLSPLVYGTGLLMCYIILRISLTQNFIEKIFENNYKVLILFSYFVYYISIAKNGIYFPMYKGTFENSNTMGIFAASTCSVILARLLAKIDLKEKISIIEIILILFSIVFAFLSWSRISIITIIGVFFIFMLGLIRTKHGKIEKKKLLLSLFCFTLTFLSIGKVYSILINKFIMLSSRGDISNGRSILWRKIWQKTSFWGDGEKLVRGGSS